MKVNQAIGQITKKVYATGKHKADVFRELNDKYPYKNGTVYPELLMIVERSDDTKRKTK